MNSIVRRTANVLLAHSTVKPLSDADFATKYANRRRTGKTAKDHKSKAWGQRFVNRQKPIRRTSSHRLGGQDNRSVEFWGG